MKKVVLLGDSIRLMGYGSKVPELLGDGYEVWQPEQNGMYVSNVLRQLFDNAQRIQEADIVHFNSGEWDVCELFDDGPFTPLDMYVSQILRIADVLQKQGKAVIFATTTPVRPENRYNHNEMIRRFNEAAVLPLREKGVAINDLYAVLAPDIYGNICDDLIHLSEQGVRLCAESTVKAIKECAAR